MVAMLFNIVTFSIGRYMYQERLNLCRIDIKVRKLYFRKKVSSQE